ncbi:hypothetical protein COLU111180_01230 [Cohnella lubricantis]|uniref:Uncharacterized protein n=1 Tax=Cohnella lubricantis TaxID=2163172 RepID=A0A841TBM7_9BACL|nr:hypothetical protein [Cohnella lubricantis]MBB6678873.1 hypothetical protein [Cohnella lubricantis]MBP2120199.1 hypothetical protein [Cohnella lubricantis]
MSKSRSKQARLKAERSGALNPEMLRGGWQRKPQTQVQPNKKAQQRRTQCRQRGGRDGADSLRSYYFNAPCA